MPASSTPQPAVFRAVPPLATALVFDLEPSADPRAGLLGIRGEPARGDVVIGLGEPVARALGARVSGLRAFPALEGVDVAMPSTQGALWAYVLGDERGALLDRATGLQRALGVGWRLQEDVDAFRYQGGRDLTGYEDGTENPQGAAAIEAAVVGGALAGVAGGSFVAAQRYVHGLAPFHALDVAARDAIIGRGVATNEELPAAPVTAHVKRAAQESFDPPAFMLRRSMPWGGLREHGIYFVAYVESLDRFERVLRRMAGLEDGHRDALLAITRAVSGGYYFCPPMFEASMDLRAFGIAR